MNNFEDAGTNEIFNTVGSEMILDLIGFD